MNDLVVLLALAYEKNLIDNPSYCISSLANPFS